MTGFRATTIARLARRVAVLKREFPDCLHAFESSEKLFSGPSRYFHLKTIGLLAKHRSVVDAFYDDRYLNSLYAMLTAWGLHRMGPGNAKLRDIEDIRKSLIANADRIRVLQNLRLSDLGEPQMQRVRAEIWEVLSALKVSRARAFLVANSKALHHVLPGLMPPVDREYTLSFFFEATSVDGREETAFRVMFPAFWDIARSRRRTIKGWLRREGWSSSETKVIDNAIVGYWWSR